MPALGCSENCKRTFHRADLGGEFSLAISWNLLRLPAGNEVGRQVVGLIGRLLIVIANSKIQREAAVHPKVVLRKQTEKVGAVVLALAQHLEEARAADEEVSHRVSGILPIKGEPAIIESRKARSESDRMVF